MYILIYVCTQIIQIVLSHTSFYKYSQPPYLWVLHRQFWKENTGDKKIWVCAIYEQTFPCIIF
jgi:hypothetical protein